MARVGARGTPKPQPNPSHYQKLFKKLEDIGIVPIFFDTVYFNPKTSTYETGNFKKGMASIEGTTIRNSLANNIYVEDWLMRKLIQTELHKITQPGETMFIE